MNVLLQALISGLASGAVYALVAMGYNAIFAATRIFNLAQAQVVMVAIIITWWLRQEDGWPTELAIVVAVLACVAMNIAVERLCVAPIRTPRGAIDSIERLGTVALVTTLGASLLIQNCTLILFGNGVAPFTPYLPAKAFRLGGATIAPQQILMIGTAAAVAVAYQLYMKYTAWGLRLQAMAEDPEAAAYKGVRVARGRMIAFGLAGLIAGVAGVAIGPIAFADPTVGFQFGLSGFVALAIGGFGTKSGPILGSFILGMSEALVAGYIDGRYRLFVDLAVILAVLSVRPQGLASGRALRRT